MEKFRSFLGIEIPEITEYQARLSKIRHDLDVKLSITKPQKYHLTTHFFGNITNIEKEKIELTLSELETPKFNMSLEGTGVIPPGKPSKTRVLFIDIRFNVEKLLDLIDEIRSKLRPEGFQIPNRPFLPHLTVARVKRGKDIKKLTNLWLDQQFSTHEIQVKELSLIKSELSNQGSVYTNLTRFNLS